MTKMPDFIISGGHGNLQTWPRYAMSMNCLWCYCAERENGPACDTCRKPGYCALTTGSGLFKVLPIRTAPNFTPRDDREILLITATKTVDSIDVSQLRRQLQQLVRNMGEDVLLFESSISLKGETEWVCHGN